MLFTYDRVSLCFLNVRRSWTLSRLLNREMHYHCAITEPTAMCWLCCWIKFCSTQYNTPRSFCLADYSDVFCDLCPALLQSTNHSNCIQALSCDTSDKYATLSHTNSQVGFVRKSAPPVTFHAPWFLCRPVDTHSSPNTCFIVTTTGLISDRSLATVSRLV
jgi:hypothetical protein